MPPIVTAERLSKTFRVKVRDPGLKGALAALVRPRYRDVHAVRDVTFRIEPGEIVAFLGPNGAGKTTTLKMLTGLLYPTTGRVEVAGFVPWTGGRDFKRRIALALGTRRQPLWARHPAPPRRHPAAHVALHAGRDSARVACAHHQPRAPAVRRCPRCPGGADCAHQADRAGAGPPPRRRHGGDARRVRHRAELPFSQCR